MPKKRLKTLLLWDALTIPNSKQVYAINFARRVTMELDQYAGPIFLKDGFSVEWVQPRAQQYVLK